jgi:hypothetical protein
LVDSIFINGDQALSWNGPEKVKPTHLYGCTVDDIKTFIYFFKFTSFKLRVKSKKHSVA